ncbi:MAG TPA: SIMPL domain-containing protein [Chitinophagaceae bacterium]|jgi:hypothetical protein|nr:SIMPL domain-containing protein [Chitinophagaceae bacterium]
MKQILFIATLIVLSSPVIGQQIADKPNPFPKTVTVTGSSEMEIIPDEIYVIIDLREYEKRGQTKTDIETIKSAFLQKCREIGLPDSVVTIASYEGYNNPWLRKKKKADLYASISYQIKFNKSSDIDKLVDKLDDDATQNFRIVKTSHSKINEFRKQLKIQAIKAAKDKGIYLTEAIGEKLGEAITISESEENLTGAYILAKMSNSVSYYHDKFEGKAYGVDETASVDFKRIKLNFEVNVVFALK